MFKPAGSAIRLILFLCAALLMPRMGAALSELLRPFPQDLSLLRRTHSEQRREMAYGDRNIMGYKYLRDSLAGVPELHFFPVARYRHYGMNANVIFDGLRTQVDDRMLVGIDLLQQDFVENHISQAKLISKRLQGVAEVTFWAFLTNFDYDEMTRVDLVYDKAQDQSDHAVRLTLLKSPQDREEIASWQWPLLKAGGKLDLRLDPPVKPFSFMRGSMPFMLVVETIGAQNRPVSVAGVAVSGVKVQLREYTLLDHDTNSFVAVKTSFLEQVNSSGPDAWRVYFESFKKAERPTV